MEVVNSEINEFKLTIDLDLYDNLGNNNLIDFNELTLPRKETNNQIINKNSTPQHKHKHNIVNQFEITDSPVFRSPIKPKNTRNLMIKSMDQDINLTTRMFCDNSVHHTPKKNTKNDQDYLLMSTPFKKQSKSRNLPTINRNKNTGNNRNRIFINNRFGGSFDSDTEILEGRFENDFEMTRFIGKGNFGAVYEVVNKLDKMKYAIKQCKQKINQIDSKSAKEVQALASLSANCENSNIVRYYSAWIENKRLYLQMEYCQSSLQSIYNQHLKSNKELMENEIRKILEHILKALKYLHSQQIVHLDIKPENILQCDNGVYKLADLGLARISKYIKNQDIEEGDCRYLGQEVLNSYQGQDLTKSDIFSLGITIYQLMTSIIIHISKGKELPKNGEHWLQLRQDQQIDPESYSEQLVKLVRSMMDSDASNRPSAAEILNMEMFKNQQELELKWQLVLNRHLQQIYTQTNKDRLSQIRSKSI